MSPEQRLRQQMAELGVEWTPSQAEKMSEGYENLDNFLTYEKYQELCRLYEAASEEEKQRPFGQQLKVLVECGKVKFEEE